MHWRFPQWWGYNTDGCTSPLGTVEKGIHCNQPCPNRLKCWFLENPLDSQLVHRNLHHVSKCKADLRKQLVTRAYWRPRMIRVREKILQILSMGLRRLPPKVMFHSQQSGLIHTKISSLAYQCWNLKTWKGSELLPKCYIPTTWMVVGTRTRIFCWLCPWGQHIPCWLCGSIRYV